MKAKNFGRNLKEILSILGMSQKQLSVKTGLTPAAISQLISGQREPSLGSLVKILTTLNVSLERILK